MIFADSFSSLFITWLADDTSEGSNIPIDNILAAERLNEEAFNMKYVSYEHFVQILSRGPVFLNIPRKIFHTKGLFSEIFGHFRTSKQFRNRV